MFCKGFEKIAVSDKWLSKRLARGEMSRRLGTTPKSDLYGKAMGLYKSELKDNAKAHQAYLSSNPRPTRQQFRDLFGSYGLKKNSPDPVLMADMKGRIASSKRPVLSLGATKSKAPSGSLMKKIAPFAAGFGAIGAGLYAYKKLKGATPQVHTQPEAQIENNHYVPDHLQRDPGFALLEA